MTCPIDRALSDPALLGAALGPAGSWATWLSVLRAAFGLPLTDDQRTAFMVVAGGREPPARRVRELWAVAGRRSGKSRIAGALAVYLGAFVQHRLSPGEKGMVLVLAASQEQARTVFGYALAFLTASPILAQEVSSTTAHTIELRNGITIAIHSNSFRTVRGRTLVACVMDEVAFWRDETSASPDIETYRAILPSLATTRGMLFGISTGYRRNGLLHAKHREHFGMNSDNTLVVQGSTRRFNSTLDEATIAAQVAADPSAAVSEWEGGFRDDIATFFWMMR